MAQHHQHQGSVSGRDRGGGAGHRPLPRHDHRLCQPRAGAAGFLPAGCLCRLLLSGGAGAGVDHQADRGRAGCDRGHGAHPGGRAGDQRRRFAGRCPPDQLPIAGNRSGQPHHSVERANVRKVSPGWAGGSAVGPWLCRHQPPGAGGYREHYRRRPGDSPDRGGHRHWPRVCLSDEGCLQPAPGSPGFRHLHDPHQPGPGYIGPGWWGSIR